MNSWTFNKIAGAVLGTILLALGLNSLGGAIFSHHEVPEDKQGFAIAAEDPNKEGAAGGGEAAAPAVSLGTLLAKADATKGATEAKACAACHDFTSGGPNKVGPNLYDIVDRAIGSHEGFAYSDSLKAKTADKWTYEALDHWIKDPKGFIPGNKMGFGGVKNDEKRANLLAYLATLSAAPKPFPAP